MIKEIGGYFGLEQLSNKPYYKNLIELNTGRNALLYIIKAKRIKKIYIPCFLCNSVSNVLDREQYAFEYYNIDKNFNPIFNKQLLENEYLYIVNYYGQITNSRIRNFKKIYKRIVVDNTHAFFQLPVKDVDTIYSCRKFFGVPDGAYLSTSSILEGKLETEQSCERMKHILGRFEGAASDYYDEFKKNDKSFASVPLKKMSLITRNILGGLDYKRIKKQRNSNYDYLEKKLKKLNPLMLKKTIGPYVYPFYIDKGVEVRKVLAQKKIYIPILWPNVLEENERNTLEYKYAANILPLPCDQRYGLNEMLWLVESIKLFQRR